MLMLLLVFVAIFALALGFRRLSQKGLPLTKKKTITGAPAKIIGGLCILFGLAVLAFVGSIIIGLVR